MIDMGKSKTRDRYFRSVHRSQFEVYLNGSISAALFGCTEWRSAAASVNRYILFIHLNSSEKVYWNWLWWNVPCRLMLSCAPVLKTILYCALIITTVLHSWENDRFANGIVYCAVPYRAVCACIFIYCIVLCCIVFTHLQSIFSFSACAP